MNLQFRRVKSGWYVAAIEPNELYVHVRRFSDKPRCAVYGWDLIYSNNEHSFERNRLVEGGIEGLRRAKRRAIELARALRENTPANVTMLRPNVIRLRG